MDNFIKRYKDLGYSFFNTSSADKKVLTKWTQYQERKPTDLEIDRWLQYPTQNWAIVCGEISNLVVIDVDTKNGGDPTPFLNRGMFEIKTPSGGYHFYTTYDPLLKSTKHLKKDFGGILHGVDIQSNKALVFAPPSKFPKGGYEIIHDLPIAPMPDDIMAQILECLEPEKESTQYTPYIAKKQPENGRPGDIFNALASWDDVLLPLGWTKVGRGNLSGVQFWRRPGKDSGVSASTNWRGYDLFFPYTTAYSELVQKRGYTKFNLYATLNHGADYRAASKALVMENYKIANKLI